MSSLVVALGNLANAPKKAHLPFIREELARAFTHHKSVLLCLQQNMFGINCMALQVFTLLDVQI
jgi:hypothetical protein